MKGQPLSVPTLVKLIFCHMHDNSQLTTLAFKSLKLRVAICKQLKCSALPRWYTHSISLGHYYGKRPRQPYTALVNPRFQVCTSLAPRPITVVFGLGTRLSVCMHTTFENGILRNGQQPGSAVNSFIDQDEFGAMKTLSGRIAPHCDKHQFCDKMTVST